MNIIVRPGQSVPQDHIEWLITRYGWRRIALAILSHAMRKRHLGLKPFRPAARRDPPHSDHLRRDIGLSPETRGRHYLDLR